MGEVDNMQLNRSSRVAFTLLEVILALALSALLLGALTVAIQTSLKATYSGRADVAEAQLARAALERIGNDLRAAVWVEQPDPASLVVPPAVASLTSSSSSGGQGGPGGSPGSSQSTSSSSNSSSSNSSSRSSGSSSSGGSSRSGGGSTTSGGSGGSSGSSSSASSSSGGGGGAAGGGAGGGGASSGSSSSSGSSTAATQMPMPMFIGGQNWLQVDVSHLPRPDQYAFMQNMALNAGGGGAAAGNASASSSAGNAAAGNASASGAMTSRDRISEMKTVYYFLAGQGGGASQMPPGLTAGMTGNQQGLMRREADRAVTAWTMYGGGSAGMGPALEALAPEIESLSFQYFSGSAWTTTWDSRVNYCLPRAVEIRITLADSSATGGAAKQPARRPRDRSSAKEYVLRVPIPAWRPANLQLLNTLANQAAASSGATGSSTSTGAGGAGSY